MGVMGHNRWLVGARMVCMPKSRIVLLWSRAALSAAGERMHLLYAVLVHGQVAVIHLTSHQSSHVYATCGTAKPHNTTVVVASLIEACKKEAPFRTPLQVAGPGQQ
jgi:hypothetical protein